MTPHIIQFYSDGRRTEILRISTNGIWANPDIPTDEAAKLVLAALDWHIKTVPTKAIADEREECAKVCESGKQEATDWDSSQWDQACENRAIAIRARGKA